MIEVPIYVPSRRRGGTGRERRMGAHLASTVAPRSAIVGSGEARDPDLLPDMVVVYYEGNLHGASNMVTFADRAMHAYWRMRERYPTVAMMAVPVNQLVRAGNLYPEFGRVEVRDVRDMVRLCRWLEIPIEQGARLGAELKVSGVRVGPAVR